jgi:leukotriene-A4 hydrolase
MSANETSNTTDTHTNTILYSFAQPIPIPSYLLAMAVGNLVY